MDLFFMYEREELLLVGESADIKLVVCEIQKKGEDLLLEQGIISVGMEIFYRVVYILYRRKYTQRMDSIGALVVSVLDLAGKVSGSIRRIVEVVRDKQVIDGFPFRNEEVRRIRIGRREIVKFVHPEKNIYLEGSDGSVLRTEMIISSILEFNFSFMDLHEILYNTTRKKSLSDRTARAAWIILTDILSYPFLEYFTPSTLVRTAELIARKISKEKPENKIESVSDLEREVLYIYVNNCTVRADRGIIRR